MTMADKSKLGKKYPTIVWEVERGKIRELVRAIGDKNPIYSNREIAEKEGYQDCPASPTFLTIPTMVAGSMATAVLDLQINFAMVLHGEEEYEYYREIYPGDVISGVPTVMSIEEKTSKSGRAMDMVTMEIVYTNQRAEKVAKVRSVIVERK